MTTVGVKDLVVVQTKDAVLIANRNAVQDVKKIVESIKANGRHEHHTHREVYRPRVNMTRLIPGAVIRLSD